MQRFASVLLLAAAAAIPTTGPARAQGSSPTQGPAAQSSAPASSAVAVFAHQGVARDAVRYEAQVKGALPQQDRAKRAREVRAAGEKLLAAGNDPRGAMKQLASAAALDPADAETWLALARAALAIKPEESGNERFDLPVNASAAAYIAYQRAGTPTVKARALSVVGEAFRRRSFWRPAMDALKASLAITDNAGVRQTLEALRAEHGFRMMDFTVENDAQEPRLCVQFSERLQRAGTDLARFVSVDGKDAEGLSGEGRQICIEGLAHGKRYEVQLRAGLPSEIGETLLKPAVIPVYVRDRAPAVRFSGKSYVLPTRGQQGLPVSSVNASRIGIEIYRVADRNLVSVTGSNGDFLKQLSVSDLATLANDRGAKIYSGELEVETRLNAEVTTAVPIGEALPELKPGVYAMAARVKGAKSGGDDDSSGNVATQWFIVSDLGLAAFTGENGMHAFVRSISSTEPINGATVRVMARNNEVLAQGRTDGAGYVRFEPGLVRGEGGLQAALLVAETAQGQYAFLDIASAAFDLSDRGVKGREKSGPIDAFLYADRGVYRPGETVKLNGLVRERTGVASAVPATLIVTRPDGVEHSRVTLTDQGLGGRAHGLKLSGTAMTGTWRAKLHTDPKADPLSTLAFLVEDFVPERLELKLTAEGQALVPEVPGTINVSGRYLYGPPGAGLAAEAEVIVKPAGREVAAFPGYRFGLADEKITPVRKALEGVPATDAKGELPLEVMLPPIPRTVQPLSAEVMVRLREPGGRAIERKITLPVDPKLPRIGIRPLFTGDAIGEGETAQFDAILLDAQGRRVGGKRVAWTLYRLESNWQWYRRDDTWQYEAVTLTRKVANGQLDTQTDTPARIEARTDYGRYRLELAAVEAGGPTSSVVFTAGWNAGEQADTPEMLDVALDKASYKAGETAKLKVATRTGGKMLVTVLANGLATHRTVDVPNGGGEVALEVGKNWGAGVYVTATLYRALDEKARRMPTRAIGLKWLQVDQAERTLQVGLDTPARVGSGKRLSVPVKVDGLTRGEEAYVTIAAVDAGILNLTRFEAPKPEGWFYAQTKLGTEIRDLYGRLIDGMRAERGKLRSGGDDAAAGGGMSMSGSPPVEALLALHSGIVKVGADGTARAEFDLPDFNGQVRVMAVAWSGAKVGHGVKDVIVREPIALTAAAPRFLTLGDEARLDLSLHNVEGVTGPYQLVVEREAGTVGGGASILRREVRLNAGERRSELLSIKPGEAGISSYDVRITGPGGIDVKRKLTFDVKVPGGDIRRVSVAKLNPRTGKLSLTKDLLADLIPGSTSINVNVGPVAAFDVPGLLTQLDRYPYGCAEQTTSRALPLLYANEMSAQFGIKADAGLKERVQGAVDRVLEMQNSSGAFGIWGPRNTDMWLTAYITDFLTRAKEGGYEVKAQAFTSALDRLQAFVSYAQDFQKGGEDRAYALYVLTRNGRAPAGELRYYVDTRLERFSSGLAKAQLGAALAMIGERERAEKAFRAALGMQAGKDDDIRPDYGSRMRDGAALVALASEVNVVRNEVPQLVNVLAKAFSERTYTSTQEQAWMLLAARSLAEQTKATVLDVGGVAHQGQLMRRLTGPELIGGEIVITNTSEQAVDAVVSVIGAALTPEPATEKGFKIERTYYTLDGKKVDMPSAAGGQGSLKQNERLVVVVKVDAKEKGGRVLVVDRLPAGLEIENPRIVESGDLKSLEWLKTTAKPEHTEFRDDRFVAAFNFSGRVRGRGNDDDDDDADKGPVATATVAYMVRAVTPGSFVHPAATVEDMYRPERYARTAAGRLVVRQ